MRATRREQRNKRHFRVRKKVSGSAECPRLAVYRSNRHIYAQVIDDVTGRTLAAASTLDADAKGTLTVVTAATVGRLVGQKAKAAGIDSVVFDRGGYQYHGRIAALADAAREAGLKF